MKSFQKTAAGLFCTFIVTSYAIGAAFTPGNIVVERVGDGSVTLNSSATNVFVDEYLTSTASQSSPVQTISLPHATTRPTSSPFNLMDSGSASSDGQLTRSADGSLIQIPGYNGITGDASIVNSEGNAILRVIGTLNSSASIDTSRTMVAYTNGNNFRSVVSVNGSAFWCAGANSGAASSSLRGIVYFSSGTATKLLDVNARYIGIANGQLFYSTPVGSGAICALGSGLPASGSPASTIVITNIGSPNAFQFNPTTNICYIADDRASKGGVFKYTYTGGIWVSNYLFATNLFPSGTFGLAVDWSGANPVIYATTADGKNLIKITDTGSGATPTTLATVDGTTKAFHGVAFAPKASTSIAVASSENPSGFNDSVNFTAALPSAATGNVTFKTNGVVLSVNAISSGVATSSSTTALPRGTITVTAEYVGDANYFGSTNNLSGGQVVTNHPPTIANIMTNTVTTGNTWSIAITNLATATGWSDPDSDTVTLNSVDPTSANGTNMTSDATYIYYSGAVTAEDHFNYIVTDGSLTATGTIYLEAAAVGTSSIGNPTADGNGHPTFSGQGIATYTYGVESTTNLGVSAWIEAGAVTAGGDGSWNFTDTNQTNPPGIFYRLYYPDNPGNPPQ